uniref:Uncharacterized protein n=1 Tax=Anguilla anguilla TaxID=7936 RepID=A0A0E9WG61_ANGAN
MKELLYMVYCTQQIAYTF